MHQPYVVHSVVVRMHLYEFVISIFRYDTHCENANRKKSTSVIVSTASRVHTNTKKPTIHTYIVPDTSYVHARAHAHGND